MANSRVVLRRMKFTEWQENNPVLDFFEVGILTDDDGDTGFVKFGDAKTNWNDLPYVEWKYLLNLERQTVFSTTLNQFDYDLVELIGMQITEIQFGRYWMIPADWELDDYTWKILDHENTETDNVYVKIKYKKA